MSNLHPSSPSGSWQFQRLEPLQPRTQAFFSLEGDREPLTGHQEFPLRGP